MRSNISSSPDSEESLPKASVIITTKNEERTIVNTIKSVLRIDYPNYEVTLIDGGSEDRTVFIVKRIIHNSYPLQNKIKIIQTKDYTPGQGRNLGIKSSSCKIIAFVDGDCYVARKDWLKNAVALLEHDNVGGVGGPIIPCSQGSYLSRALSNTLSTFLATGGSTLFTRYGKQKQVKSIPSCNAIYRREALEKAGLYSEDLRFCEDAHLNYKIRRVGYHLLFSPNITVEHDWKIRSFKSLFCHMLRYGSGRADAGRKYHYLLSPFHALPSIALLCLSLLLLLSLVWGGIFLCTTKVFVSFYGVLALTSAFLAAYRFRDIRLAVLAPIAYVATHVGYAIGFILGLTRRSV